MAVEGEGEITPMKEKGGTIGWRRKRGKSGGSFLLTHIMASSVGNCANLIRANDRPRRPEWV